MKPLSPNSLFIGKVANYLSKVNSTNAYADELLSKSTPNEGTAIYTDNQYAGRGQIGSKWESSAGENITMSVILYPRFLLATQQFKLNQVVSLAIYDVLKPFIQPLDKLKVKWPNDIYIGDNKIGGVLIENKLKGSIIASTVVGVGLNINQLHFSPGLPNPTSLRTEIGKETDVYELMSRLCECLEHRYLQLKAQQFNQLEVAYQNTLYGFMEWKNYEIAATRQKVRGKIVGLSSIGKIIVQIGDSKQEFSFKELILDKNHV